MNKRKKIILVAMLLAMNIILSRFLSIKTPITKISFAFLPTMLCAFWLGPKWTLLLNVLGDLIGATLFPTGAFFIGYTVSTAVSALIYGCLLYQGFFGEKWLIFRTILATVLVAIIVNMGLNTLWTSITAGQAFWLLLGTRIVKQLVMIPIHVAVFLVVERALRRPYQKYLDPTLLKIAGVKTVKSEDASAEKHDEIPNEAT